MLRSLLLVLLAVFPLVTQAQLVESIEVRVTNLDVVVTDRSGNPVTGLTKDDFVVVEDGKEQPITNFYEIRAAAAMEEAAPAAASSVPENLAKRRIDAIESEMLRNLEQMIGTLAGVEGKKALIFLGAELPQDPGLALLQQLDSMYSRQMRIDRPASFREGGKRSLGTEMRAVAHEANANGVTMYLVDTADRGRQSDPTGR